jgi:hypothetical protein
MGVKILYRRAMNIGFILINSKKFIPFNNSTNRLTIDKICESVLPQYADGDIKGYLYNSSFTDYLAGVHYHYKGEALKKFKSNAKTYEMPEQKFLEQIVKRNFHQFEITGKDALDAESLDFIFGVMLDVNKSVRCNKIAYDYKDSDKDDHPFMKMLGVDKWDDVEYTIRYKDKNSLSSFFNLDSAYKSGKSLRRSEVEKISSNGSSQLIISTKTNAHFLNYDSD